MTEGKEKLGKLFEKSCKGEEVNYKTVSPFSLGNRMPRHLLRGKGQSGEEG